MDYLIIRYPELLEYNLKGVLKMYEYLQVTIHTVQDQLKFKQLLDLLYWAESYELRHPKL